MPDFAGADKRGVARRRFRSVVNGQKMTSSVACEQRARGEDLPVDQVRGGQESAAAKPFTVAGLAEGAVMPPGLWYTAWVGSAAPLPKFDSAPPVNTMK